MLKHKTSVLFVNTDGRENKVIQVPTNIILNWRKYLIFTISLFSILILILSGFIYTQTSEHYKEKLARANKIKRMIDLQKVKKSFKSIDASIARFNKFMTDRGLHDAKIDHVGGEAYDFEVTDIDEITSYYEEKLKNLEKSARNTPIGFPMNSTITSKFGYRENPFTGAQTELHPGIDFRGTYGDPIKTMGDGVVKHVGPRGGYGNCVIIKHANKIETLYGHLSKTHVKQGQNVNIGQLIGEVGSTGRSTGPHLHYEIIKDGEKINPMEYIKM